MPNIEHMSLIWRGIFHLHGLANPTWPEISLQCLPEWLLVIDNWPIRKDCSKSPSLSPVKCHAWGPMELSAAVRWRKQSGKGGPGGAWGGVLSAPQGPQWLGHIDITISPVALLCQRGAVMQSGVRFQGHQKWGHHSSWQGCQSNHTHHTWMPRILNDFLFYKNVLSAFHLNDQTLIYTSTMIQIRS